MNLKRDTQKKSHYLNSAQLIFQEAILIYLFSQMYLFKTFMLEDLLTVYCPHQPNVKHFILFLFYHLHNWQEI